MRCKLSSVGNELALLLNPAMLEQVGISAEDEVELTSDGQRIFINRAEADGFERAAAFVFERYGTTLSRLAD